MKTIRCQDTLLRKCHTVLENYTVSVVNSILLKRTVGLNSYYSQKSSGSGKNSILLRHAVGLNTYC